MRQGAGRITSAAGDPETASCSRFMRALTDGAASAAPTATLSNIEPSTVPAIRRRAIPDLAGWRAFLG